MPTSTIRTAYSLHILRAYLEGFKPLPMPVFARTLGFVTNLEN